MISTAFVRIWGKTAGAIAWDADSQLGWFEYDAAFLRSGYDLSPLKMPISRASGSIFRFPELRPARNAAFDTFKGLPGLLADVLPDKYGNQLIDAWLAQQGRPVGSMNPVEMLCFLGTRGMGALEFEPAQKPKAAKTTTVDLDNLVQIAQNIMQQRQQFATNIAEQQNAIKEIITIGTSAGGARPKVVIAYNSKTGEVRSGQTLAPQGFEHWLLKLDGVSDVQLGGSSGFGRVEMAYYLMSTAAGIDMMPSRLLEENGRAHFMTRRFDREGSHTKHHLQTFCAMKHFDFNDVHSYSYEQLFQTMRELKLSYPEAEEMYRRMVFNVLARNCDDHTKNFSFLLKQGQSWQLAPAYDVCHAYRPDSVWVSQHALSIVGKRQGINKTDLLALAKNVNVRKAESIIDQVNSTVLRWPHFAAEAGVDAQKTKAIADTLIDIRKV
jgi:serine/threonine-protein kinase HipA